MTLKDAMISDESVFVNPDEFGVSAVFSGTGEEVSVLVDNDMDQESGLIVPVITARTSDVSGIKNGDTFTTASSRVYKVVSSEPALEDDLFTTIRVYE